MNYKKILFIASPVIAAIIFSFFPGSYKNSFLLFGMFLVLPVYTSWLPDKLQKRYGESTGRAYLYSAASLLLYELIYTIALKSFDTSAAGAVTVLLPWLSFAAGILVWKLLSEKKHLMSLIPSVALFFVSALPSYTYPMLVTICSVFVYISISLITLIFNKLGKNNADRVNSTKRTVLVISSLLLLSVIISVASS